MAKQIKKVFIILMFIMIATMTTQKSYAAFLDDKYFNKTNPYSGTFSITLEDLMSNSNWTMLCSEHGRHIPGSTSINNAFYGATGRSKSDNLFNSLDWIKSYSSSSSSCQYSGKTYHSDEVAYYATKSTNICTPKAAYIFNYMQEGVNSYGAPENYTDIQKAWYNILEGAGHSSKLYNQASAYQTFVKKIAKNKNDVENTSTYVNMSHKFEDGQEVTIKFPEVDKEKIKSMLTFNSVGKDNKVTKSGDSWASNVTVNYNEKTQKYLIGPFSINYIEANSNGVDFSAIKDFDIYTNASNKPVEKEKWRFVWQKGQREENDDFKFPHKDEVFYIEMDYIENATMLTGMDVDYKYLIAGAQYQDLEGTYDQYLWKVKRDVTGSGENISYKWYFQAKKQNLAARSQKLALVDKAARWYETEKIQARSTQGDIEIIKKAVDENGKELSADEVKDLFGEYQYFDFKVKITHSTGEVEEDVVTARAGKSVMAGPYSWSADEDVPTFTVEEIPDASGRWNEISVEPKSGKLENGKTISVTATNQIAPRTDKIELTKTLSGPASEDEQFKFEVVVTMPNGSKDTSIAEILVPKGQVTGNTWISKEYNWYGEVAPTYEIIELETEASKKYNPSITPSKGSLNGDGSVVKVNALNGIKMSYLTIEKELQEGQITEDTFDFKVTVDGVKNTESGRVEFTVSGVKAGQKVGPYGFEWKDTNVAPTYTVEEININSSEAKVNKITAVTDDGKSAGTQDGNKITGQLVQDGTAMVSVKFTNDMTKHQGGIKVIKDIYTTEKISKDTLAADGTKFDIEVVISGTFVHNGKTYQNSTEVITKSLPDDGKWSFDVSDVVWYGSKAPTFTVTEKNLPKGWKMRTISYSDLAEKDTSSEGHKLIDGKTIEATIVNELPSYEEIDLTFSMAGIVWIDNTIDEKNNNEDGYYSSPNGVYDAKYDTLKENAEVTVYRVVYDGSGHEVGRTVAKAYKDANNTELAFPIITKSDGKWEVPRISVPALTEDEKAKGYSVSYDVEFVYDGQTYEPTEFLSYQVKGDTKTKNTGSNSEKAQAYKNAKTSVRDKYAKDSMALAYSDGTQKVIAEVSGKTAIDANGDTTGMATFTDGTTSEISYHSDNAGTGYPTMSKVQTTDRNGLTLDIFKAKARTSTGDLTFPFNKDGYDGSSLMSVDKTITDLGVKTKYKFMAVYNYCLNINLGLKEKPTVDIGLTKKLDNAKVIVKEKMYQYNYSGNYDLTEEKVSSLDKDIKVDNVSTKELELGYTLGLYRSDYYYRAEMYKNGEDKTVYDRLENFYTTLGKSVIDTEMDIYLTYKIKLMNNSSAYDAVINSLEDYYDSSFTLIRADESKYLKTQTIAGKETDINAQTKVAIASDYADKWTDVKKGIVGSDKQADGSAGTGDNIVYNKMIANGLGIKLAPGEAKDVTVTFKVNKADNDTAKKAIMLGQKCNVAEIASYSTFVAGTNNYAGKIDRDSAPSNVNIAAYNNKAWYEDDTFAAPRINVNLVSESVDRTINGMAWEDNSKDENTENPNYNQKVGDGVKQDNEKNIEDLTTELVEKVIIPNTDGTYTEYDYIWPTEQKIDGLNNKTIEETIKFDSTITTDDKGNYQFINAPSGDYVVRFTYGDKKIESADYSTAKYYNGQDYKSARLKAELKNGAEIKADSYLDIDKVNATQNCNTAIDSEARRLQVVSNSREIVYDNAVVMAEYQDELFKGKAENGKYYMYADTPKIDVNIEKSNYDENNKADYKYDINNVNFGLEERPITQLTLDKQIEEITLTTSDGNTIMDAKYNINYEIADNGEITAKVELDTANSYGVDNLQALNRDVATNQGFRYINVDSDILEGTTITVRYRFTILNTGEVDRTGYLAEMDYKNDATAFDEERNKLTTSLATYKKDGSSLKNDTTFGYYVGSIYYYGKDCDTAKDAVVSSTVRQLVDYIDNDVTFSGSLNATPNTSWSNITVTELKKLIKNEIVTTPDGKDVIVDKDGVQYETENRNNLVVSVDSTDTASTINNSGFIVDLVPYEAKKDGYMASMNLTTTRYVGADSDDLQIDNIAEIIKYNNKVGRRDELSIPGDQEPAKALETNISMTTPTTVSAGMAYQRDTSATEVITLSPPTGTGLMTWKLQVAATITAGLAIIAGGIVLIKKKILK